MTYGIEIAYGSYRTCSALCGPCIRVAADNVVEVYAHTHILPFTSAVADQQIFPQIHNSGSFIRRSEYGDCGASYTPCLQSCA